MRLNETRVFRDIPRANAQGLTSLKEHSVADVHDALPPAARSAALLTASVAPVTPGLKSCGLAVTAYCVPGDSLMSHCAAFFAWPGDMLVISNGGVTSGALWGEFMAIDAKRIGVAGTIVDAPVRDSASFRALGYPVWASSVSVSHAAKVGEGYVNMPIVCGGRIVNPGDVMMADDDGVLAFSPTHIPMLLEVLGAKATTDAGLRSRLARGERLFETQNFGQLLAQYEIHIHEGTWLTGQSSNSDSSL